MFGEEAHEVAEILVTHVNHWCDGKVLSLKGVVYHELGGVLFHFDFVCLCLFNDFGLFLGVYDWFYHFENVWQSVE